MKTMDRADAIASILSSDDLRFGVVLGGTENFVTMKGGGLNARMKEGAASAVLELIDREWGDRDAQCIILRGMINSAFGTEDDEEAKRRAGE